MMDFERRLVQSGSDRSRSRRHGTLRTGASAALVAGLLLVSSTAAASYPKTRVGGFFEDPAVFLDGERDLSVETSSGKSSLVGPDGVGRNLFYNRFRYYDPSVGRYLSSEPIWLFGVTNPYVFAGNTTGWIDPYGLAKKKTPCQQGSYTITFGSGKKYHGKGPKKRAQASARRVAKEHNEPAVNVEWTPAKDTKEAFKAEHIRMMTDEGGHLSPNNYNKIASPGKKIIENELNTT